MDGFEFVEGMLDGLEEVWVLKKWEVMNVKNYIKMNGRVVYIEKMVFYIWTTLIHAQITLSEVWEIEKKEEIDKHIPPL